MRREVEGCEYLVSWELFWSLTKIPRPSGKAETISIQIAEPCEETAMRREYRGPCELSHRCYAEVKQRIGTKLMTKRTRKGSEPINGRINCHFWKEHSHRACRYYLSKRSLTSAGDLYFCPFHWRRDDDGRSMRRKQKLFDPSVLIYRPPC